MEQLNQDANQAGRSSGMVDRARQTAAAQLTTQKTRAAEALGSVAAALRQSSQPLRDNNQLTLGDYAGKAADQLEQLSRRFRENPFLIGAAAAVVGALVAAAVPATESENRLMGESRDTLVEGVQQAVKDRSCCRLSRDH